MVPAASARTRGELWAPCQHPCVLGKERQAGSFIQQILEVPPRVQPPAPRTPGQVCQAGHIQSTG